MSIEEARIMSIRCWVMFGSEQPADDVNPCRMLPDAYFHIDSRAVVDFLMTTRMLHRTALSFELSGYFDSKYGEVPPTDSYGSRVVWVSPSNLIDALCSTEIDIDNQTWAITRYLIEWRDLLINQTKEDPYRCVLYFH